MIWRLTRNTRGLSPRVRGNRCLVFHSVKAHRSIPAGAGEPSETKLGPLWLKVYPRGCGGTTKEDLTDMLSRGLSPRVRGNHPFWPSYHIEGGSIPAGAGNRMKEEQREYGIGSIPAGAGEPRPNTDPSSKDTVYPRGCGGTNRTVDPMSVAVGLSPRVRGNPNVAIPT